MQLLLLVLLGALWGASFLFIKIGLESYGPMTLVVFRLLGAGAILYAVMRMQGHRLPRSRHIWRAMGIVGVVGLALPFSLIGWGEQYITSSLAAILISTTPLFTLMLVTLVTHDEQYRVPRIIGALIGFSGELVAVGIGPDLLIISNLLAVLAVSAAALCYAITAILAKRAFQGTAPIVTAVGTMAAGLVVILPLAFLIEGPPTLSPTRPAFVGVIGLTLLSTALAYMLYYWLLSKLGASRTTMVTYLIPSFALVYAWFWLREPIGWHTLAGLLLVFSGIMLANGDFTRMLRRPPAPA